METSDTIINYYELSKILEGVKNNSITELADIFKSLSYPTIDNNYISIMGIKLDPSVIIYNTARAEEIIEGWKFLQDKQIPVDVYVNSLLMHLVHNTLLNESESIPVDEEIVINIESEPEIIEFLRFCYWVNKSRNILNKENFESKFSEIEKDLQFGDELETRKKYGQIFTDVGKYLQEESRDDNIRLNTANNFYNELNQFRIRISSFIPEFMLPCIIKEEGFDIKFNQIKKTKEYDLFFNSYPAEVKTIIDQSKFGKNIEENLNDEIEGTLKREKILGDINNSLSQGAEITFLFLTFSSLGSGFVKYTYKQQNNFSVKRALTDSLILVNYNRTKQYIKEI
ncbi:MAG: hypothetical protein ACR2F1_02230 [Nitrososphaeraceae archaeon]